MASEVEIDDSLYSRQRYVLGDTAMQRMAKSNVLLCGLGGLGVEIAKNIILAGVKSLTIQDSKTASYQDLGTQFFLRDEDVKTARNRAEASCGKLSELNPYVSVKTRTEPLNDNTDLSFLLDYQCVILTEATLSLQLKINNFCRSQSTPIMMVIADVYGVFCWAFCDFGPEFEVADTNGEEPKDVFISDISKANPGVVTTLENRMHGFEDGDEVIFKEIKGMDVLNGKQCKLKVLTPYTFSICDTSGPEFNVYENGGIASQIKVPKTVTFESLEKQLAAPACQTADLSKLNAPANIHLGLLALHRFWQQHDRLPNVWCNKDADALVALAKEVNKDMNNMAGDVEESVVRSLAHTSQGCLAPLTAFLGGVVAQEALKAVTGKFMPLRQWFHLDACELLTGLSNENTKLFSPQQNRYDALRICVGDDLCQKLADLRLFMVGCGAIGCEMLKNYALLGIASSPNGQITITDNDLIEKSNLNRQFLFRPRHIRQPKSTTAAASACDINPSLRIDPHQHKVCPQTESSVYTDAFFESQGVVVNALDNLEARRYMDSRCVTNQRALLESGTMGAKGHVQVIVPHLTESYSSQRDPADEDVPYCTLKSFPAVIEHCIQWARDKFESSYAQKPALFNKFWSGWESAAEVVRVLGEPAGAGVEGAVQVSKLVAARPEAWAECVALARAKFEKYFNHKAQHLLNAFPLDQKLQDGSPFWQSPKRPPTPQEFNPDNEMHLSFVRASAKLYADMSGLRVTPDQLSADCLRNSLHNVPVPPYKRTKKSIETDESAQKPAESLQYGDEVADARHRIKARMERSPGDGVFRSMVPLSFEKDVDSNGHIDFITAAANLRASMYSIEAADRLKVKRIAGRIVPAIATTTAAVAGLVSLELLKLLRRAPLEDYKNTFLNLALPIFVLSEPGAVDKATMSTGVQHSLWDRWEVRGGKDFTLAQFIEKLRAMHGLDVTMVVHGVKMIYVPIMPGHRKRLPQSMLKLLKPAANRSYVDLVVSYTGGEEDQMGPPVRYFLH